MSNSTLLTGYQLGYYTLSNKIVMAPMTRARAIDNTPNDLMVKYYQQRSDAGLIITEAIAISPNGLGASRQPGLFNEKQVEGWKKVTRAVHRDNGRIFAQLTHSGRVTHSANQLPGAVVIAPSAVRLSGKTWTDTHGVQQYTAPQEMTIAQINQTKKEFVDAAVNAIEAGFDGVELHGANGYLLEQFLSPSSNTRTDEYGGSVKNRIRFILEVVEAVASAIGKDKTGIRLSPFNEYNEILPYDEAEETYLTLATKLNTLSIAYIHLVDNGSREHTENFLREFGRKFSQTIILAGNYSKINAESALSRGLGNLVAFGKPFINNPDLVTRFRNNWPLADNMDTRTFYTEGERGYTDYPAFLTEEPIFL